jgi:hypothetical protein
MKEVPPESGRRGFSDRAGHAGESNRPGESGAVGIRAALQGVYGAIVMLAISASSKVRLGMKEASGCAFSWLVMSAM